MRGHAASSAAHERLFDEAQILHERLHRVTVALAITEDLLADRFEDMASPAKGRSEQHQLEAKRARAAATECRLFAARLEALGPQHDPDPEPPQPPRLV